MYFSAARLAVPRHVRAARSSSLRPRAIQDALRQVSREGSAGFTGAACPGIAWILRVGSAGLWSHLAQPCQSGVARCLWKYMAAKQLSQVWELRWQQEEQTQKIYAKGLPSSCHRCGSSDGSRRSRHRKFTPRCIQISFLFVGATSIFGCTAGSIAISTFL